METSQQINAFAGDLDSLVHRFRYEFDLSYASVIGVLTLKAHALCAESLNGDDEEGDDETEEIFDFDPE